MGIRIDFYWSDPLRESRGDDMESVQVCVCVCAGEHTRAIQNHR